MELICGSGPQDGFKYAGLTSDLSFGMEYVDVWSEGGNVRAWGGSQGGDTDETVLLKRDRARKRVQ